MRVLPLGVGDAFSALHYTSSILLESGGQWLLLDCPHPIRKILREGSLAALGRPLDVADLAGVAVTHLHADHSSGLEGLGFYAHFALRRRMKLLAHPDVSARLWERLAAGMEVLEGPDGQDTRPTLETYFEVIPLDEARPVRLGPFEVECRKTWHPIPTTALRVRADGRAVAHSADTRFDPALVEWLLQADLVLHETGPGIHTPLEDLEALPAEKRARMRLIHYPDELVGRPTTIRLARPGEMCDV
ncbi:MAG TPA: MBL fold metallo-hydrolase [Vicinamibacteria bacterium]|nr:MBL fold metallo-hydrolase [Vicinamibacteria bacterium]